MNLKPIAALSALLLSGSVFAQTLVTVNGTNIDSSEIDRRAQFTQQRSQGQVSDGPELRQFLVREMVVETVVSQEARRLRLNESKAYKEVQAEALKEAKARGEDKKPDFKVNWNAFENQLLMMAFADNVLTKNPVNDAQVEREYNEIKSRYNGTDEVQIGQIVTQQTSQAQAAIKELAAKKSFASVAKKYTIDPDVKAGAPVFGEYVAMVDLKEKRPQIYQAIAGLKKGEYTKTPISGEQIQVIFYVNDKRPITVEPFEQLRESIYGALSNERIQSAIDDLIQKANIVPTK